MARIHPPPSSGGNKIFSGLRNQILTISLALLVALPLTLVGCKSQNNPSNAEDRPQYGQKDNKSSAESDNRKNTSASAQNSTEKSANQSEKASNNRKSSSNAKDREWVVVSLDDDYTPPVEVFDLGDGGSADVDMSTAVDDDIWRQMDLAGEYYSMGLVANQDGDWDEAQYYFERSLKILGALDIETESDSDSASAEWEKYNSLLENIIAAYNVTLLSLGKLPADISPSALVEKFGDFEKFKTPNSSEVPAPDASAVVTYDMPIEFNERVQASIKYFQTDARDAFLRYYSRSTKYIPMMREIIRSYGLPEDLVYLPLVESGYNPAAYSWAKAVGLWQFISSTGKLYGLDRSWWIDERRDPVKATHAACKYLKWLYGEFGDWNLALASYNAGPGKVSRTMKKDRADNYWDLKGLRRETRNYVPLFMAATIICKDPRKYGFDPSEVMFEAPLMFEEVVIDKCLEVKTIADAVGVSVEDIQDLNPELLRKHTPPKASKYKIKLPIGTRDSFMSQYAAMESPQETSWVRHTIRRGETISTIAARYGVSQYAIREANNMHTSRIYAGKTLIVPVPLDGAPSGSPRDRTANNGIYIVQSGDALYDISRSFGISVKSLKDYNGIGNSDRIYVNQRLRIPGQTSSSNEYAQSNVSKPSPKPASTIDESGSHMVHKVRRGENLTLIAKKYDVSVAQLRVWNNLGTSLVIYPGQRLKVYGGSSSGESDAVYVVRGGDSLWEIATRYGVSVNKLIAWNDLSTSAIQPGQRLRLNAPDISGGDGPVWHVVRRGENLSRIASLYNTSVKQIMNDNNIRNPRSLRVGVKLKIGG